MTLGNIFLCIINSDKGLKKDQEEELKLAGLEITLFKITNKISFEFSFCVRFF